MTDRFRLGIIGAGMISAQSHLPAALASSLVEVTAIVDPVESRAAGLARSFGIQVQLATRLEEVLGDIEGAIIATPNATHRDLAVRCLDAGVHVLVEKPLAVSAAEGEKVVSAAERSKRQALVGYVTRHYRNFEFLQELLSQGYFGCIRRFHHQFGTTGGWTPLSGYTLDREATGGGVLVVTGTHFLDRMLALWGYPRSVEYADDSRGGSEANCCARLCFDTRDGIVEGTVRYSKTARLPGGLVLDTDLGRVVLADTMTAPVVLRAKTMPMVDAILQPRHQHPTPGDPFVRQIRNFVQACRGTEAPRVSAAEGVQSLRLLEQMYAVRTELPEQWYRTNCGN
jgi:predicted dehydrogenase